jgi:hypothetical protein
VCHLAHQRVAEEPADRAGEGGGGGHGGWWVKVHMCFIL